MTMYDDNFGHWEIEPGDDPEEVMDFYRQVQEESVEKVCARCERKVKIRPEYAICNRCADMVERGMDP